MDECDCGWCGRCAEQIKFERSLERPGWHTPPASEDHYWQVDRWTTLEEDEMSGI